MTYMIHTVLVVDGEFDTVVDRHIETAAVGFMLPPSPERIDDIERRLEESFERTFGRFPTRTFSWVTETEEDLERYTAVGGLKP